MYFIEKQIEELERIDYRLTREDDFDSFWRDASGKVDAHDLKPEERLVADYPLDDVKVYDTSIPCLDGTPMAAWTLLPAKASPESPVPCVIFFHGGGGSRGIPLWHLPFVMAGFAVIAVDFRMQGGVTGSNTPMRRCVGGSFANLNLDGPRENYYFYHLWTDAMLTVKYALSHPCVKPDKVAVAGASQGGGVSLAMAALSPRLAFCSAAVPSYCAWERRLFIRSACAGEIAKYLERYPDESPRVFKLLSYFDVMNFVDKIKCPVLVDCGLKDPLTPPDCVYAAYNKIKADKRIVLYPFGDHSACNPEQLLRELRQRLNR